MTATWFMVVCPKEGTLAKDYHRCHGRDSFCGSKETMTISSNPKCSGSFDHSTRWVVLKASQFAHSGDASIVRQRHLNGRKPS